MFARLQHMKEAEDRLKASLFSAANSTFVLAFVLLLVVVLGIVIARL